MKKGIYIIVLAMAFFCGEIYSQSNVAGTIILEDQTNYSGVKVTFKEELPGTNIYEFFTDSTGAFNGQIDNGIYYFWAEKSGFLPVYTGNFPIFSDTTFANIFLQAAGLNGALKDTLYKGYYKVSGDISVNKGNKLVIMPGVILGFMNDVEFIINGELNAVGTPSDIIKFTSHSSNEEWKGIIFNDDASDSSIIKYATIEYSNSSGIFVDNSSPTFDHLRIQHCFGTWRSASNSGAGIFFQNSSSRLSNSFFLFNRVDPDMGGGSAIYAEDCNITMNQLVVGYNENGAAALNFRNSAITIINSSICHNSSYGFRLISSNNIKIYNTLVAFNDGKGIEQFTNNYEIYNCNSFGNTDENYAGPTWFGANVTKNSNGVECDAYFNISVDPLLLTNASSPFQFSENSPNVDAGDNSRLISNNDILGRERIVQSSSGSAPIVDIGAYENSVLTSLGELNSMETISFYPNPFSSSITLNLGAEKMGYVTIIDQQGSVVFEKSITESNYTISPQLASGMYFISVQTANEFVVKKVVKD